MRFVEIGKRAVRAKRRAYPHTRLLLLAALERCPADASAHFCAWRAFRRRRSLINRRDLGRGQGCS